MNLHLARYVDRWVGLAICFGLWLVGTRRSAGSAGVRIVPPLLATTPPPESATPRPPRRVLGIKFYGLGNIAMILPTLAGAARAPATLRDRLPHLAGQRRAAARRAGSSRDVLTVEVGSFASFVRSVRRLLGALRRGRYDAVLDFEQFMKLSGIFALLDRRAERGSASTPRGRRAAGSTRTASPTPTPTTWRTSSCASCAVRPRDRARAARAARRSTAARTRRRASLRELGVARRPSRWSRCTSAPVRTTTRSRSSAGTSSASRALADDLVERHGARVVFTGQGRGGAALIDEALAAMRQSRARDLACDRARRGRAARARSTRASFVVSNDTSVMHLAGAGRDPGGRVLRPDRAAHLRAARRARPGLLQGPLLQPVPLQLQPQDEPLRRSRVHARDHGRRGARAASRRTSLPRPRRRRARRAARPAQDRRVAMEASSPAPRASSDTAWCRSSRSRGDRLRLFDMVPPPATPDARARDRRRRRRRDRRSRPGDMRDPAALRARRRGVEVIYHLAAGQRMKPQFARPLRGRDLRR